MFNLCGDHAQSARKPRSITAESMLNFAGFAVQTERHTHASPFLSLRLEACVIRSIRTQNPELSGRRIRSYPDRESGVIRTENPELSGRK